MSPLLANVLLDEVDKELEARGLCFARYADDCNVYVGSRRAGEDVMAMLKERYERLHLKLNESKSAVARPQERKFLGYSFWYGPKGEVRRKVAPKALEKLKARVRGINLSVPVLQQRQVRYRPRRPCRSAPCESGWPGSSQVGSEGPGR